MMSTEFVIHDDQDKAIDGEVDMATKCVIHDQVPSKPREMIWHRYQNPTNREIWYSILVFMASTVNLLVGPIAVVRVFNIAAFTVFAASVWLKEKHSRHSRHSWCLQLLKKQEGHLTASSKH